VDCSLTVAGARRVKGDLLGAIQGSAGFRYGVGGVMRRTGTAEGPLP
jgi:hypothetical protein